MVGEWDYLLVVDYLSKFPVVKCLNQTTVAAHIISPKVLVSDNGPQFRCNEFAKFLRIGQSIIALALCYILQGMAR